MCSIRGVAHLITTLSFRLSPPSWLVGSHHGLTCYLTQHRRRQYTLPSWAIHPHATVAHPRKDAAPGPHPLVKTVLCACLSVVIFAVPQPHNPQYHRSTATSRRVLQWKLDPRRSGNTDIYTLLCSAYGNQQLLLSQYIWLTCNLTNDINDTLLAAIKLDRPHSSS
jgi:hypothetical protein